MLVLTRLCLFLWIFTLFSCASGPKTRSSIMMVNFGQTVQGEVIEEANEKLYKMDSLASEEKWLKLKKWLDKKTQEVKRYVAEQIFLRAQHYYLRGEHHQAQFFYQKAQGFLGKREDAFLKTKQVISLIRQGKLAESESKLERLFSKNSTQMPVEKLGLLLGGIQVSLDQTDRAIKTYEQVSQRHPKSREACLFLGKALMRKKNIKKALLKLKDCDQRLNSAQASFELARYYANDNKLNQAQVYLNKTLKRQPKQSQAVLMLGGIYEEKQQDRKAQKLYFDFLEDNPEDYLILNKMASLHFAKGQPRQALSFVERLVDLDDGNRALRIRLGILYVDNKLYHKAINLFSEYLDHYPKEEKVHYYLAAVYQEVSEVENAIFHYSQISQESSLFEESVLQIAALLSQVATDDTSFEKRLLAHIEKHFEYKEIRVDLAIIGAAYFENKQLFERAVALLEKIERDEKFQESHLFYLISLYEKQGVLMPIEKRLSTLINEDANNVKALNYLGYFYLEKGIHFDKAYQYISRALSLKPNDGYIRDSLGWYYFLEGDFNQALTHLERAYQDSEHDLEVANHLAQTYQALGRKQQALKYYKLVLKNHNDESMKKRVAQSIKTMLGLGDVNRLPASVTSSSSQSSKISLEFTDPAP